MRYALAGAHEHMKTMDTKVYSFVFDHAMSFDGWGPKYPFCINHTCHGSEVPFTFHTFDNHPITEEEHRLSNAMVDYWTNFAHSGSPNKGPNPPKVQWAPFTPHDLNYMHLTTPNVSLESGYRKDKCDMWDKWGYRFHNK